MPREIAARRPRRDDDVNARRRRAMVAFVASLIVLLTVAIMADSARAGTYVMRNCDVPGYPRAPLFPWILPPDVSSYRLKIEDTCAAGGGVSFTLGEPRQMVGNTVESIGLYKPTGPRSHITFVKAVLWYAARLGGSGQPLRFWSAEYRFDTTPYPGLSNGPPGSENLVGEHQLGPDTTELRVGLACGSVPGDPCVAASGVPLLIRGMEVTLSESIPPVVSSPSGALLEGGVQSGIRGFTYSASDPESGLSEIDVLLDDTVVATDDVTSRCSYSDFTVCPASRDATLQVDTRLVANGSHTLTLRVRDAAGNERLVHGMRPVVVANAPNAGTSAAPFTVVAKFNGTSRTTLTVPYGRRVVVRGRLTQGSAAPAVGTPLEVLERLDRKEAREKPTGRVVTKADGSFSVVVATNRPSRTVRLAYRPVGGGQAASQALKLRVRAASRVRASLRGRVVRFSGRVLSGPIPRRGKRVEMQGRSPGSAWTPFRLLRTDRKGRFSGTYRLRVRRPGVVLKVRAVVPREDGYGYLSSGSRAVALRVR